MNLCLDIGNTRVKYGVFRADTLIHSGYCQEDQNAIKRLLEIYSIEKAILSSTQTIAEDILRLFNNSSKYIILGHHSDLPFQIEYDTPATLGRDRIAGIAGAQILFPKQNVLVIDAGTCITYDILTADRRYIGGNISPGLRMRLQSMHTFTDQLPLIDLTNEDIPMVGTSTKTALLAGAVHGARKEIQGFVQYYKKRFINLNIVLTGGDAPFFVNSLKSKIFADSNLVLKGLNGLLNFNV